jgi:putative intracellular protease/amidase
VPVPKVLILTGDAAESLEVMYPYQRLREERYEVQTRRRELRLQPGGGEHHRDCCQSNSGNNDRESCQPKRARIRRCHESRAAPLWPSLRAMVSRDGCRKACLEADQRRAIINDGKDLC